LTPTTDTYVLLRAFVDELARCGLAHACTSPGSRSTPLVLSLVRDGRIRCHSHIDERCAAFFGLGIAKATGLPVALACTSGTAAAHFTPAVIEAYEARVPLIVLTADRPPELREVGAGQTIDQLKLYGGAAKWFFEVGTHAATPERERWIRTLACRAFWTAVEGRPGPIHLNFPLREPLVLDEPLPPPAAGRPDGRPWVVRSAARRPAGAGVEPAATLPALSSLTEHAQRPLIVAGRLERRTAKLAEAAHALRIPLLADPLSGLRTGPAAIAHYDAMLRDERFRAGHGPDLVVRIGDLPTSKPLRAFLADLDVPQVAVDPEGSWQDPAGVLATSLAAEPAAVLAALAARRADPEWLASWRRADERAAGAIDEALGEAVSEPRVAAELGRRLPSHATLFVASSMPVRDVETFWPLRDDPPRVLANRGANGIDGTVSSAYGAAAAATGPVVLLLGDVALVHDVGGLLAGRRLDLPLTIVLLDNDGGGIFEFLPVATQADAFEEHVATPHGLDVAGLARVAGCEYVAAEDLEVLGAVVDASLREPATTIVHVRTDRKENVELHRHVWPAVARVLASEPSGTVAGP